MHAPLQARDQSRVHASDSARARKHAARRRCNAAAARLRSRPCRHGACALQPTMNEPHRDPDAAPPAPWTATARLPECPRLDQDATADVCIVGAGIAGLTTAYLLANSGHSVVVVDDGALASGMTSRTTAHLTAAIDDRYVEIERLHGERGAQLAA